MMSSALEGTEMASTMDMRCTEDISMSRSAGEGRGEDDDEDDVDCASVSVSFSLRAPPMSAKENAPNEASPAKDFFKSLACDCETETSVKESTESRFLCTLRSMKTGREPPLLPVLERSVSTLYTKGRKEQEDIPSSRRNPRRAPKQRRRAAQLVHQRAEHRHVVLARLGVDAEDEEEQPAGEGAQPPLQLDAEAQRHVVPEQRGDLVDVRELEVRVRPGDPGAHGADVQDEDPDAEGDAADDVDAGHAHEAEVAVGVEVGVPRQDLLELEAPTVECDDRADYSDIMSIHKQNSETVTRTTVDRRYAADNDGRDVVQEKRNPGVVDGRVAAHVLVDVEPIALRDVYCGGFNERGGEYNKGDERRITNAMGTPTASARSTMTAR